MTTPILVVIPIPSLRPAQHTFTITTSSLSKTETVKLGKYYSGVSMITRGSVLVSVAVNTFGGYLSICLLISLFKKMISLQVVITVSHESLEGGKEVVVVVAALAQWTRSWLNYCSQN